LISTGALLHGQSQLLLVVVEAPQSSSSQNVVVPAQPEVNRNSVVLTPVPTRVPTPRVMSSEEQAEADLRKIESTVAKDESIAAVDEEKEKVSASKTFTEAAPFSTAYDLLADPSADDNDSERVQLEDPFEAEAFQSSTEDFQDDVLQTIPSSRRLLGTDMHNGLMISLNSSSVAREDIMKGGIHTVKEYSLVSLCKGLWAEGEYALALSLSLFSGLWPLMTIVLILLLWFVPMDSDIRQGVCLALSSFCKWGLISVAFFTVWIPIMRFDVPLGQVRLQADSGTALFTFGVILEYFALALLTTFEKQPEKRRAKHKGARNSISFHAVFFTLAFVAATLLVAALTTPAYDSTTTINFVNEDGQSSVKEVKTEYTLMSAGISMYNDSDMGKYMSVFYMILVTTLPGIFLVSAAVAWVTSPLDRDSDEDTTLALSVCNVCARLVSLDVWLYAFVLTYIKLDNLADVLSDRGKNGHLYTVSLHIKPRIATFCGIGCVVCLWMMHTLAQYAHSAFDDVLLAKEDQDQQEPLFPPPSDLPLSSLEEKV